MKTLTHAFIISISLSLMACPQKLASQDETITTDTVQIENELAKTSTGRDTVNYLNNLRQNGFQFIMNPLSSSLIQSQYGTEGGNIQAVGVKKYKITFNNDMNITEKAHMFAHELVHVKDDLEIEQIHKNNPHVESAVKHYLDNYKTHDSSFFDPKVISYIVNTRFCMEARAYTKNMLLSEQGLSTSTLGNYPQGLGNFINERYIIQQFNLSYGSSAEQMKIWCLQFNSMTQIQNQLIW